MKFWKKYHNGKEKNPSKVEMWKINRKLALCDKTKNIPDYIHTHIFRALLQSKSQIILNDSFTNEYEIGYIICQL